MEKILRIARLWSKSLSNGQSIRLSSGIFSTSFELNKLNFSRIHAEDNQPRMQQASLLVHVTPVIAVKLICD